MIGAVLTVSVGDIADGEAEFHIDPAEFHHVAVQIADPEGRPKILKEERKDGSNE